MDGMAEADATQLAMVHAGAVRGGAHYDESQVLQATGEDETAAWHGAGLLCTIGLLPSLDGARLH
eukprot:4179375-Pleurochrysis_carterae.AAC.1